MPHPFIHTNETVKAELCYTYSNQKTENVFHFHRIDGIITTANMLTLAASLKNWFNTNLKPLVVNTMSLRLIRVTSLETQTAPGIEYTTGLPLVGSVVSTAQMPNNSCLTVKWITGLRGRSYRGRTYHMGIDGAVRSDANTVGAAHITSLLAAYTALISADVDWEFVVLSQMKNGLWLDEGDYTQITSCAIENVLDSQRRRLPTRGQ